MRRNWHVNLMISHVSGGHRFAAFCSYVVGLYAHGAFGAQSGLRLKDAEAGSLSTGTSELSSVYLCLLRSSEPSELRTSRPRCFPASPFPLLAPCPAGTVTPLLAADSTLVNRKTHTKIRGLAPKVWELVRCNSLWSSPWYPPSTLFTDSSHYIALQSYSCSCQWSRLRIAPSLDCHGHDRYSQGSARIFAWRDFRSDADLIQHSTSFNYITILWRFHGPWSSTHLTLHCAHHLPGSSFLLIGSVKLCDHWMKGKQTIKSFQFIHFRDLQRDISECATESKDKAFMGSERFRGVLSSSGFKFDLLEPLPLKPFFFKPSLSGFSSFSSFSSFSFFLKPKPFLLPTLVFLHGRSWKVYQGKPSHVCNWKSGSAGGNEQIS